MPYVLSLGLLVLGLLVLVGVLITTYRAVRRFRAAHERVTDGVGDRAGLLGARAAALRVAISQRRHGTIEETAARVSSSLQRPQ